MLHRIRMQIHQEIELELLFGVVEPREKGDEAFPLFGDTLLTFVLV